MIRSNRNRWSLLSGAIFVILWVVSEVLVGQTEYLPEAGAVTTLFTENAGRISIAGYLGTVSTFFLLWFAGNLRGVLKGAGEHLDPWADIAFGGGAAASVVVAVAFSSIRAVAERAETAAGISPDAATAVLDVQGQLAGVAMPIVFAVFIGATGFAVLRSGLLPGWFGWVSAILALTLLSPLIYVVMPVGLLWTLVLSIWLFVQSSEDPAGTLETATSTPTADAA